MGPLGAVGQDVSWDWAVQNPDLFWRRRSRAGHRIHDKHRRSLEILGLGTQCDRKHSKGQKTSNFRQVGIVKLMGHSYLSFLHSPNALSRPCLPLHLGLSYQEHRSSQSDSRMALHVDEGPTRRVLVGSSVQQHA